MDALTEFLGELDVASPEIIAATIRRRFTVIDRERGPEPEVEAGQVWKNKQSGRLVLIDQVGGGANWNRGYDRVQWTALSGRGPKTGRTYRQYWRTRFEFVADSENEI